MASPKYKLTYFVSRGKAEVSRLVFVAAGVEFQDNRIPSEQWPDIKPTLPMKQVPVLEVGGVQLCQSLAIARYLAREFGFYGRTHWEGALIDQVLGHVDDMLSTFYTPYFSSLPDKADKINEGLDVKCPPFLARLEDLLNNNTDGNLYFVGKDMTLADLQVHQALSTLQKHRSELLRKYPLLRNNRAAVSSEPRIAAYLATCPDPDI